VEARSWFGANIYQEFNAMKGQQFKKVFNLSGSMADAK